MPVIFAFIGLLVLFVPTRCVVGCAIDNHALKNNYENREYVEYVWYDGPVHEYESEGGKEIGMIPKKTILLSFHKNDTETIYKLKNGVPVRVYIKAGDSAGYRNRFRKGRKRQFFMFWKYAENEDSFITEKQKLFDNSEWVAFFTKAHKRAYNDVLQFWLSEGAKLDILEHVSDDFDGEFKKQHKGCYELGGRFLQDAVFYDKKKIYYISGKEYKKFKELDKQAGDLYLNKLQEYIGEIPYYARTSSLKYGDDYELRNIAEASKWK